MSGLQKYDDDGVREPLSAAERAAYWQRGYIVLRGLMPPAEAATWRREAERLLAMPELTASGGGRVRFRPRLDERPGTLLDRIDVVEELSPVYRALAADPRIVARASAVLGEEVRPFKSKLIIKTPGISGYVPHQDYSYWQFGVPADAMLTVLVAIDGATRTSGALEFFPDAQQALLTPSGVIADPEERDLDLSRGEPVETEPGDVVLFHSLALHRSAGNASNEIRVQFYASYAAARYDDLAARYADHYREHIAALVEGPNRGAARRH